MKPYQLSESQLIKKFGTDLASGLSRAQVQERRKKYGFNVLPETPSKSWLTLFISQFKSPLIYILLCAAIIIYFVGSDRADAFIIVGVLFFNSIIGTIQEGRVTNILASLKRFIKSECIVIRNGEKHLIDDSLLVPGDIIFLQGGQRVPADARIIESNSLQVNEAILTGESSVINKNYLPITQVVPTMDQRNMLFCGTYILSGSGMALVVATALDTEVGKIHKMVEKIETDMPLKKELKRLSYWILLAIFFLCAFLFVVGFLSGKPLQELLVMLTALFICVVPEGLPVVLTLALVTGVYRMAKQKVLVKRMQAVEGLGRTNVIITDKTGTLTRNEMIVSSFFVDGKSGRVTGQGYHIKGELYVEGRVVESIKPESKLGQLLTASYLLNSTDIEYNAKTNHFSIKGDPTEAALFVFSQKSGLVFTNIENQYKKLYEIPFDSRWKYHAVFYEKDGKGIAFIAGSAELLMRRSKSVDVSVSRALRILLDKGLRIIVVACKDFSVDSLPMVNQQVDNRLNFYRSLIDKDLTLLGLLGIEDSIRPDVRDLVQSVRQIGIKIIMATGDHKKTALYVAKRVGIFAQGDELIDGSVFSTMPDDKLMPHLYKTTVYSRVTPQDKFRLVNLFRRSKAIVAMTGDGVNDAPSLVAADLGIAMGQIGTEVAKDAADIILLDDSFVNIIKAIEQGRHIFCTLRRVILYFFATNMGEVLIVLFALIFDFPLPLTAAQILWLNLVTDGFMDVALSTEPKDEGLLTRSWFRYKMRLVDGYVFAKMLFMSIPMGVGSLLVFNYYYQESITRARTMTLITMALFQWFNAWNCRSESRSLFSLGLITNGWLVLTSALVIFLQFFVLYAPFMQKLFKTVPLSFYQWIFAVGISFSIIIIEEARKWVVRRYLSSTD